MLCWYRSLNGAREIGIGLAVGARARDILRRFLVEAVCALPSGRRSWNFVWDAASIALSSFLRWPTLLSIPAIVASVAVSCTVGIIFGFYPAWKACAARPRLRR